jgi:hypothetical protein
MKYDKGLLIERHLSENLPFPLFAKEGYYSSLWKREGRRDFLNNVFINFKTITD